MPTSVSDVGEALIERYPLVQVEYEVVIFEYMVSLAEVDGAADT